QRSQLLLVSSDDLDKAAAAQYRQVVQSETPKGNVNHDPKQTERVRAIARRLIPQTAVFRRDAPQWKWEVNVITSPEVNAWCMPGGKIAVYTGIIEKLQITDDELAAVMGHEIAHALRENGREGAREQAGGGGGGEPGRSRGRNLPPRQRADERRSRRRRRAGHLRAAVFARPRDRSRPHGRRARGARGL